MEQKMNQTPLTVSVIVPIYKVESYLQQCIDSIRTQSYSHLEIILVDDGSPDNCGKIADKNAQEDSRIIVIHKENGGLSSARNAGLNVAKGAYISFIDSDDTIHPQFIEILLHLCKQYDCDISQCDYLTVADYSVKLPLNPQQSLLIYNSRQAIYQLCCTRNAVRYVIACNKLYRRELFHGISYPVGKIHEDEFTTYKLLWAANKIIVTNQYLYYYLQRPTSIMGNPFSVKRLDVLEAYKERLAFLKDKKLEPEYWSILQILYHRIQTDCTLLREHVSDCEKIQFWMKERERIGKILKKSELLENQMIKNCNFPPKSQIVLYGAGHWGRIIYNKICENQQGKIVGWVDNAWANLSEMEYPIMPVDTLLRTKFDFVLITIREKLIQEEIRENLLSWGIPKSKIISIDVVE